jgi:hypothetical protein
MLTWSGGGIGQSCQNIIISQKQCCEFYTINNWYIVIIKVPTLLLMQSGKCHKWNWCYLCWLYVSKWNLMICELCVRNEFWNIAIYLKMEVADIYIGGGHVTPASPSWTRPARCWYTDVFSGDVPRNVEQRNIFLHNIFIITCAGVQVWNRRPSVRRVLVLTMHNRLLQD